MTAPHLGRRQVERDALLAADAERGQHVHDDHARAYRAAPPGRKPCEHEGVNPNSPPGRAGKVAGLVVAGLFGLVGVGAAVAMVVTGDDAPGGKASAQALAEATVATWIAGDGDRAVGLMPSYDELAAAVDCPRVDGEAGRVQHQRQRAEVWAKAQVWKRRRPHLRQVEPGEVIAIAVDRRSAPAWPRCRSRCSRSTSPSSSTAAATASTTSRVTAVQLGQRWYLMDAGALPPGLEDP